jgi:hypothetical protein
LPLDENISDKSWTKICALLRCDPDAPPLLQQLGRLKGGYAAELAAGGDWRPSEIKRIWKDTARTADDFAALLAMMTSARTASHLHAAIVLTEAADLKGGLQKAAVQAIKIRDACNALATRTVDKGGPRSKNSTIVLLSKLDLILNALPKPPTIPTRAIIAKILMQEAGDKAASSLTSIQTYLTTARKYRRSS